MLVLKRNLSEKIFIQSPDGTVISLMLVDVRGKSARIGIDAPRDWVILRPDAISLDPPEAVVNVAANSLVAKLQEVVIPVAHVPKRAAIIERMKAK